MASHRKFCKKWLYLLFEANHFPCVCLLGKSRLTSSHENVIHVTSGNLDDFKIIQISNISVSFAEKRFRYQWWRYLKQHLFLMTLVSGLTTSILFPIRTPHNLNDLKSEVHVAWVLKCSVDNTLIAMVGYWARCTDTGQRMTSSKI